MDPKESNRPLEVWVLNELEKAQKENEQLKGWTQRLTDKIDRLEKDLVTVVREREELRTALKNLAKKNEAKIQKYKEAAQKVNKREADRNKIAPAIKVYGGLEGFTVEDLSSTKLKDNEDYDYSYLPFEKAPDNFPLDREVSGLENFENSENENLQFQNENIQNENIPLPTDEDAPPEEYTTLDVPNLEGIDLEELEKVPEPEGQSEGAEGISEAQNHYGYGYTEKEIEEIYAYADWLDEIYNKRDREDY